VSAIGTILEIMNPEERHAIHSAAIKVNEKTLAVDELRNLGPGANFLTTNHTFDNYKDFLWQPDTFSNSIDIPKNINALSDQNLMNRANEKVKQIMKNHTPYSLDEGLGREVDNIVHKGEKELVKALKSGTLK
jgi:trimethylamine---corrinoid protein Co-methyltransferase